MVEVFRDILSYFRQADRRDLWICLWAAVGMTIFVAISQGGRHPIFEQLFAENFGANYSDQYQYHWWKITYFHVGVFLAFFLVPVAIIKIIFSENLADYGLMIGDWKWGCKFLAIWCVIMLPATYINSFQKPFLAEYPLVRTNLLDLGAGMTVAWIFIYLIYYIGWEFLFRGFMQIGLAKRLGAFAAIMMQTLPSTIIHIGKPIGETASAILGGLIFGAVALRTRSILWPLLAHWYIGVLTEVFTSMNFTG